ncbi:hypothetical protein [Candidatus Methanocrinis natronophilus]|uniref:Uncharacterized protein n=1 Tax=Candidatus Methanocrinis natronophilus TaxID=3033396 RepID=A0ABT5XBA0_9EURY|nr:hypothetical protein [Candidatus Methanocrinis natronophilus]MDF0591928.1 hypothetical protein [Candidatus Methanocrinis natronophilus]
MLIDHLGSLGVQVTCRLVPDDDRRIAGQFPGHRHPLVLVSGELVGPVLEPVADSPTSWRRAIALSLASFLSTPAIRRGIMTFSTALNSGSRW